MLRHSDGRFSRILCPDRFTCKQNPCLFSHGKQSRRRSPEPSVSARTASTSGEMSVGKGKGRLVLDDPTPPKKKMCLSTEHVAVSQSLLNPSERVKAKPKPTPQPQRPDQRSLTKPKIPDNIKPGAIPIVDSIKGAVHTPLSTRQTMLKFVFGFYMTFLDEIGDASTVHKLAYALSKEQELRIYHRTNKISYKNGISETVRQLKKLPKPQNASEAGTLEYYQEKTNEKDAANDTQVLIELALKHAHDLELLEKQGYITTIPMGDCEDDGLRVCERCKSKFDVFSNDYNSKSKDCRFHLDNEKKMDRKTILRGIPSLPGCCGLEAPCQTGPHLFKETDPHQLHKRHPFIELSLSNRDKKREVKRAVALDCEMVNTTEGLCLGRVVLIDVSDRKVVVDRVVKPPGDILETNYKYSGLRLEDFEDVTYSLSDAQNDLRDYIDENTVIIGHGLENDFISLRIVHNKVLDTAILFPHARGLPYRKKLRDLASEYIKKFIQEFSASDSHDPAEDAITALELVFHYLKRYKK